MEDYRYYSANIFCHQLCLDRDLFLYCLASLFLCQSIYLHVNQTYALSAEFSSSHAVPMPTVLVNGAFSGNFSDFSSLFGTDRLFSSRHILGSPRQLRVLGGVACASTSTAVGHALSLCKLCCSHYVS